jgi:hypothetical protein
MEATEEREKERIERRLKALEREVGRLIDAYQAEVIELKELKERRGRIEEHGRMLKRSDSKRSGGCGQTGSRSSKTFRGSGGVLREHPRCARRAFV